MSELERTNEPGSTPEQARALLEWVEEITASEKGTQYNGYVGDSFYCQIEGAPEEVAKHIPGPDPMSIKVEHSLHASRVNDYRTRQPRTTSLVAIVTFDQKEHLHQRLIYATHVNYHIVSDEFGHLKLERHVTNTEHGPHKVLESRDLSAKLETLEGLEEFNAEGLALLESIEESRPLEEATGMFTVTETEAQQIIDFCSTL